MTFSPIWIRRSARQPAPESTGAKPLPDAVPALFPNAAGPRARSRQLADARAGRRALQRIQAGPVAPTIDMARIPHGTRALRFQRAAAARGAAALDHRAHASTASCKCRIRAISACSIPGANFPAQCADHIAGLFNPQLASSASSPVPVALESHVIRAVARRAGLGEEATGHFATGGSEANYTALLCALTAAHPDFARDGARAFAGPVKFYTSRDCHIAWLKIAHQAGVGRAALRLVDTDGSGPHGSAGTAARHRRGPRRGRRTRDGGCHRGNHGRRHDRPVARLRRYREAGRVFGTTSMRPGAARRWRRIACAACSTASNAPIRSPSMPINGSRRPWDAPCSSRRTATLLSEAFHASTSFMPSSIAGIDPYLNSVQWSRRFLGLAPVPGAGGGRLGGPWRACGARRRGHRAHQRAAARARLDASPMIRRSRCWRRSRPPNWAMCALWCAGSWPQAAPGSPTTLSKDATWCGFARPTAKPSGEDVNALVAALNERP